jgi:1-acyl-sn-glycerol-3-phosphate acyltransferase
MTANSIPGPVGLTRVPLAAQLRGWAIVALWGGSLLIVGSIALLLYVFFRTPKTIFIPARYVLRLGCQVGGIHIAVRGLEKLRPDQPYIFVANHQSWLDPVAMFLTLGRDLAFLAKKELYRIPILNPGLHWIDCAPIDRSNRERAIESIRFAAEKVRRGRSFIAYPEGTRTPDGRMRPFKKGAFHLAIEAGAPIVPVTVNGSFQIMPKGPIRVIPGTVDLTVHDPIDVTAYTSETVDQLAETAWHIVHSALREHRSGANSAIKIQQRG